MTAGFTRQLRNAACLAAGVNALLAGAASAQQLAPPPAQTPTAPQETGDAPTEDIVVTARLRDEALLEVPVAVSVLSAADINKYNAADLTKIGELTPSVIVSNYRTIGGGSLAIRGISSPPTQVGYEQPVSVALDGIQTSSGRVATLGFFDLQQVEVLKGPQALFFGKNSPAGVISITSAGPTSSLEVGGRLGYEFVADEVIGEGYVAGPITDTLGGRLAVRYRNSQGWLNNNAQSIANPFAPAGLPAAQTVLPGPPDDRVGDHEYMGRLTLAFEPTDNFTATFKLFGLRGIDQGGGSYSQNIGPCSDGRPRSFAVVDPFGDCRPDNQTSFSNIVQAIADRVDALGGDNRSRGEQSAYTASLVLRYKADDFTFTSLTGQLYNRYKSISGLTHTVDNALTTYEDTSYRSFSQEFRLGSTFDGPLNFLAGVYFQDARDELFNDTHFRTDISFRPAVNRIETYEKIASLDGRAYSAFGQLLWDVTDKIEFAAGARWTKEKKRTFNQNLYGIDSALGRFFTANTVFQGSEDPTPGVLAASFEDENVSPEVTLSYRPVPNSTLYVAYKTGFKSGGFGITTPLQAVTTRGDIDFDSETVEGFEAGAKGELLGGRLQLQANAFVYEYKDLQVTTYDATTIRFQIDNAGAVKQRGIEFQADYRPSRMVRLHGALAYVRNRFTNYVGQCYGYTIPAAQALTAAAPPGCQFLLAANGSRFLTAAGTAILQQNFENRAPARSPDLTGNAGFEVTVPTGNLEVGITGDAFYSSEYRASDTLAPSSRQPDFFRFNGSVGVGAPDGRWRVSLVGRNLTNRYYLLFAGDRTGGTSVPLVEGEQRGVVARGREVTLQTSFRF